MRSIKKIARMVYSANTILTGFSISKFVFSSDIVIVQFSELCIGFIFAHWCKFVNLKILLDFDFCFFAIVILTLANLKYENFVGL